MKFKYLVNRVLIAGCSCLAATAASVACGAFITTGNYDEQTFQTNAVDASASSGSGAGSIVTLAQFKTDMTDAFANNLGGVVDFDNESLPSSSSFSATYGQSQGSTLIVTRGSGLMSTAGSQSVTGASVGISASAGPSTPPNGNYLGFNNTPNGFTFTFNQPLVQWGVTFLMRSTSHTVSSLVITLDDSSTFTFGSETIGTTSDDTFYGYRAPAGRTISSVVATASALVRLDDMGFIIVPEPSALLTTVIGMIGVLAWRRSKTVIVPTR